MARMQRRESSRTATACSLNGTGARIVPSSCATAASASRSAPPPPSSSAHGEPGQADGAQLGPELWIVAERLGVAGPRRAPGRRLADARRPARPRPLPAPSRRVKGPSAPSPSAARLGARSRATVCCPYRPSHSGMLTRGAISVRMRVSICVPPSRVAGSRIRCRAPASTNSCSLAATSSGVPVTATRSIIASKSCL